MSLNAWIGVLVVLVPALTLLSIAVAVRICLLVMGDEQSESTSPARSANPRASDRKRLARTLSPLQGGSGRPPRRAGTAH